jgi:hypothetical protein
MNRVHACNQVRRQVLARNANWRCTSEVCFWHKSDEYPLPLECQLVTPKADFCQHQLSRRVCARLGQFLTPDRVPFLSQHDH